MSKFTAARRPWLVHAVATCEDCRWEEQNYMVAVDKAKEHALKTGHTVSVETCYAQIYNPKDK